MHYRKDIDGLRALAVLPVVFFHAGVAGFEGGYIGVDIFFVISGFLVASIVVHAVQKDEFSFWDFYERRARRIIPALFLTIVLCIPHAWLWMTPAQFENFGQSVTASTVFLSNVYFWWSTGYFSQNIDLLPLIHTWSLGVEAQFYVIVPVLLLLLLRLRTALVLAAVSSCIAVSLLLAIWASGASPSAGFYLLPTRAWELLVGSLAAVIVARFKLRPSEGLSIVGLCLVVVSFFLFDDQSRHPGILTIVPVIGVFLILVFSDSSTIAGRILSLSPAVWVGLISYSLYLLHQPLFAFYRMRFGEIQSVSDAGGLIALSMVLASICWICVEQPFRRRRSKFASGIPAVSLGAVVAAGLVTSGLTFHFSDGLPSRFPAEIRLAISEADDFRSAMSSFGLRTCFIDYDQEVVVLVENECVSIDGEQDLIVFGDSHAAHLMPGFDAMVDAGDLAKVAQFTGTSCRPFDFEANTSRCSEFYRTFVEMLPILEPTNIILSAHWQGTYNFAGAGAVETGLRAAIESIQRAGHNPVVLGQSPFYVSREWLQDLIIRGRIPDQMRSLSVDVRPVNKRLERLSSEYGVAFLDPAELLCDEAEPGELSCLTAQNGSLLHADETHFTAIGSALVVKSLFEGDIVPAAER